MEFFKKLHPGYYLVIYIAVTFVFALVYDNMPRSFYDQNIKTEVAYGQIGNDAKRLLASDLSNTIFERRGSTSLIYTKRADDGKSLYGSRAKRQRVFLQFCSGC